MTPGEPSTVRIVPANQAAWEDLVAIVGPAKCHGVPCFCQRFKIPEAHWRSYTTDQRGERLRQQTNSAEPDAENTCGLVAYADDIPVGWCRVEQRSAHATLGRTPWAGRQEDPADDTVWAITCLLVRKEYRRGGITHLLVERAVTFARQRGARALEGYPMEVVPGQTISWGELHVGSVNSFLQAGFSIIGRPSKRRAVVRIEFD